MKPTNATLNALLASRQFYVADLFTLTLVDGTVLRYTSGDQDIVYGGNTYSSGGVSDVLMELDTTSGMKLQLGTQSQTMVVQVAPRNGQLSGIPFITACVFGVLDGATVRRDIAIMPTYGNVAAGVVLMFLGRVAEVDIGDTQISINVNSPTELFNQSMPRNLYQPGCINTLYDASCTVNPETYRADYHVAAGSTTTMLLLVDQSIRSKYFDQGKVWIRSGAASGQRRNIRQWTMGSSPEASTAFIWPPLTVAPSAGDSVSLYPGCNKSPTDPDGCIKFNNLPNFRGFPDVPQPETAA